MYLCLLCRCFILSEIIHSVKKKSICIAYRVIFSIIAFVGATMSLDLVWNLSDIAYALMAIPNLICMPALSGVIAKEVKRFQPTIKAEREARKAGHVVSVSDSSDTSSAS